MTVLHTEYDPHAGTPRAAGVPRTGGPQRAAGTAKHTGVQHAGTQHAVAPHGSAPHTPTAHAPTTHGVAQHSSAAPHGGAAQHPRAARTVPPQRPTPGQRAAAPGRAHGQGPAQARIAVQVHAADPITRAGAEAQLRQCPGLDLVDTAASGTSGTVAVLLADTADATATAALRRLVRGGEQRVVLVVERMREAELLEAVECGVAAILWRREATAARLGQAVLAAARGDGDLPADLLGRLITQMGRLQRSVQGLPGYTPPGLSERESDVLRLVAEGWDTGEIAAKLSYSERTVKNVLHGLTTRLHLRNRAHAVAHALREGYI